MWRCDIAPKHLKNLYFVKWHCYQISAHADGGPRSRVCARLTLRSAPHRRERKFSGTCACRVTFKHLTAKNSYPKFWNPKTTFDIFKKNWKTPNLFILLGSHWSEKGYSQIALGFVRIKSPTDLCNYKCTEAGINVFPRPSFKAGVREQDVTVS